MIDRPIDRMVVVVVVGEFRTKTATKWKICCDHNTIIQPTTFP